MDLDVVLGLLDLGNVQKMKGFKWLLLVYLLGLHDHVLGETIEPLLFLLTQVLVAVKNGIFYLTHRLSFSVVGQTKIEHIGFKDLVAI